MSHTVRGITYGPIKCKDYFIIKFRYYASPYYLKQFRLGKSIGHKKHHEAARNYHTFFWKMMEMITENKELHYHHNYFMHAVECVTEEVFETHGIRQIHTEGDYIYLIPKEHIDIIQWIKDNVDIPHKVVTRTRLGGWVHYTPETWRREEYKTSDELRKRLKID